MKINRIVIITLVTILVADLMILAYIVFSDTSRPGGETTEVIRIGVAPDRDRVETDKTLQDFFNRLDAMETFKIRSCFTNSFPEAVAGFIHGSLDLIIINPAYYLVLKRNHNARIVAVQQYAPEEKEYNHAVLLSLQPIRHLNLTRGRHITFVSPFSMSGYLVPARHLEQTLNTTPEEWFGKVSFAGSNIGAFEKLLAGETDLVALDLHWLRNHLRYQEDTLKKFTTLWTSPRLPESLICVSFSSSYYNSPVLQEITSRLWKISRSETVFNRNSMNFVPVNFDYELEIANLERFLFGDSVPDRRGMRVIK